MSKKVNLGIRLCIQHWFNLKEMDAVYIWVKNTDKYDDLLRKACAELFISLNQAKQDRYVFFTKLHKVTTTSAQDLVFNDTLIMVLHKDMIETKGYLNSLHGDIDLMSSNSIKESKPSLPSPNLGMPSSSTYSVDRLTKATGPSSDNHNDQHEIDMMSLKDEKSYLVAQI